MTDLNNYLQQLKERLSQMQREYSELENSTTEESEAHLHKLKLIAQEVERAYSAYVSKEQALYPLEIEKIKVTDHDIQEAINKIYKLT